MLRTSNASRLFGKIALLSFGALLCGAVGTHAQAQGKTKLKKILVLDKSQHGLQGHSESRRDLNAALRDLGSEKSFTITTIGQSDDASKIISEFSAANLATYQAVLFSNNDGVHAQLDATAKANLEAYVKNGGGFIPIHAASAGIANWSWITSVLVESFYGPHGSNQPTANVIHDAEGTQEGTETKGIYKGLTAPLAFLDEYYAFNATPRKKPGVTILLTVDEKSYSKPIDRPMGPDHPVVWSKTEGKGRVVHFSMGHSWSTNNVFTAKNSYLKNFMYGTLRYVAGDFTGCTDNNYTGYNPDATKNDQAACGLPATISLRGQGGKGINGIVFRGEGKSALNVQVTGKGAHEIRITDTQGREVRSLTGNGTKSYSLGLPAKSGIYFVEAKTGGQAFRHRLNVF